MSKRKHQNHRFGNLFLNLSWPGHRYFKPHHTSLKGASQEKGEGKYLFNYF